MGPRTISPIICVVGLLVAFALCLPPRACADDGSAQRPADNGGGVANNGPQPPQPPRPPQPPAPPRPISDVKAQGPQPPQPPNAARPAAAPGDGARPADNKPPDKKPNQKPPAPAVNKVKVMKFRFTGNTAISSGELEAIVASYVGKDWTLDELKHVADVVTDAYRARGFSVARAYIPQQEIKDGVVEITVLEGKLGIITVEGNRTYGSDFLMGYLKRSAPNGAINDEKLEHNLLVLRSFPDLKVNATLAQGKAPGTVDMHAIVEDRRFPLTGGFDFNNFGAPSTGRNRIGVNLDWENVPIVPGSDLALRGVIGDRGDNFDYFRGGYTLPVFCDTKLNLYGFWGTFDVSKFFEELAITGRSWGGGFSFSHPCILKPDLNLTGELGMEISETQLSLLGETSSRDRIRKVWIGVNFDNICWNGHDYINLTIAKGLGSFLGGSLSDHMTDRHGATDDFTKYNLNVSRIQSICCWLDVLIRAQGQIADSSLMAPEQLQIGGADTVRGYVQGAASGDDGYAVSLEPRITFCRGRWYVPQLAGFIDHGGTHVRRPAVGEHSWENLTGAGAGVRWAAPYNIDVRFDVGWPIGGDSDLSRDPEFYISGGVKF